MRRRRRAVLAILRFKLREAALTPGYYVVLALALAGLYVLVRAFVAGVDGGGFVCAGVSLAEDAEAWNTCYRQTPVYAVLGRVVTAAFGATFANALFADGPFQIGLPVALVPCCAFAALMSVLGQGLEKRVGMMELVICGPADGASYLIATLARDVIVATIAAVAIGMFCLLAAAAFNMALGIRFLPTALACLLVAAAFFGYGLLANAVADGPAGAVALLLLVILVFAALFVGSYALVGGYVVTLSAVLAAPLQWLSPLYYLGVAYTAMSAGNAAGYLVGLGGLILVTAAATTAGAVVVRWRGVRAG